ncbi:MAG: hypothetical protein EOO60_13895 [Hymenobacter sp.]|nr:MAG: hypothetical protein EOO60_13895 [Hymenobacter sp.]
MNTRRARPYLPLAVCLAILLASLASVTKFTHVAVFYQVSLRLFEASLVAVVIALVLKTVQYSRLVFKAK